jgi:hypothetical protein
VRADYKTATGVSMNASIYKAAKVHKPDFFKWRKGTMPRESITAKRLEEFLKAQRPPARGTK